MHRIAIVGVLAAGVGLLAYGCGPSSECSQGADCPENEVCAVIEGTAQCANACTALEPCPSGEACVPTDVGAVCIAAGVTPEGEACNNNADCETGACLLNGLETTCVITCGDDGECPDTTRCYVLATVQACVTPLDNRGPGEACESPRECASAICVDDGSDTGARCVAGCESVADCGDSNLCVTLGTGQQGCLAGRPDGEACATPEICLGGRCIEDTDGSRVCSHECPTFECDAGFACVPTASGADRVCMPLLETRAAGEACTSSRQCEGGFCVGFGEAGDLCTFPCTSGACPASFACWEVDDHPSVCGPEA